MLQIDRTTFETKSRILNWFLIENEAFGRHVRARPRSLAALPGVLSGRAFQEDIGTAKLGRENFVQAIADLCSEVMMVLFSRSFVRKRLISLATTASVAATSFAVAQDPTHTYHVRGAVPIQYVADRPGYADEQPFLSENDAAMNKMMADMTIKPTGDVDRDFVAMMVPHHQGAIDMAKAELKYGHNEQLRRIAQEIIVTQQQEIPVMRLAVGEQLPPSVPSPTQPGALPSPTTSRDAMPHDSMNMKMNMK